MNRKRARPLRPRRPYRATGAWLLGALAPRAARGQPPRGIRAALHPRWIAALCVASCTGLLAACGDNAELPPNPTQMTDSAGIEIVTSAPIDAVYATVAPEPVLSIGVLNGPDELMFGRIATVALDGAGNVIVADRQSNEIRVFGPEGAHLHTLGGVGEGPGEFEQLEGAWPTPGGTIVAVDNQAGRITRFGPDGELLGAEAFMDAGLFRSIGLAGPDAVLTQGRSFSPPTPGTSVEEFMSSIMGGGPEHILRHSLSGELIDTVATVSEPVTQVSSRGSGNDVSIAIMAVPFSPEPAAIAAADGRVAVTEGRRYEFRIHDPSGALARIVRLDEEPTPRTDAHLEAWVRGRIATNGEPIDENVVRAAMGRYGAMDLPDRLPAWSHLFFADDGEIWALRFMIRGADFRRWDVFGADGGHRGQVTVPSNLFIQQIGGGRLVVGASDELGVHRAQLYELDRNP